MLGKLEEGLATFDTVLQITADEDIKDFEFLLDIETRMASVMRLLGRETEAEEIERRLSSVREILE